MVHLCGIKSRIGWWYRETGENVVLSSSFIDNIDKFDSDGQYHLGQEYRNDQSVSESYWCFYKSALILPFNADL